MDFSSLARRLSRCAPYLSRGLANRRELALLDFHEALGKCAAACVIAVASMLFFMLAASAIIVVVAAIYWDTPHRVLAVSICAGVEAVLAIAGFVWVWVSCRRWQFFQMTFEQIERDAECVAHIFEESKEAGFRS